MGKKFAEYSKLDLSEVNGKVLKKWDENQVFAKSMTEREGCPSFVFFEGPPSANGIHIGDGRSTIAVELYIENFFRSGISRMTVKVEEIIRFANLNQRISFG